MCKNETPSSQSTPFQHSKTRGPNPRWPARDGFRASGPKPDKKKYLREEKTDKEKSHKGIWWSECPGSVPGINSGRPRDTRDVWADLCGKFQFKGQNVRETDGAYDGTDGTFPRDRRDTHQGVSHQNSLCLLVFFFPQMHHPALVRNFALLKKKGSQRKDFDGRDGFPGFYRALYLP